MALQTLAAPPRETDWNRERRYQGWTDTAALRGGARPGGGGGAAARAPAARRGLVEPAPARAGHRRRHRRRRTGSPCSETAAFKEMRLRRLGGAHARRGGARASPRRIRPGSTRRISSPAPGGETLDEVRRRVLGGPRGAAAGARRRDGLPRRPRHHRPHPDPRSARARPRPALVAPGRRPTGISELEFRDDWTALHRMNTLAHLDERAGDAVGVRPVPRRAAADAAPQGRQDLPARRGGAQARGGGAPARRLPALGLPRDRDAGLRVLRRALPGHRPRPAGAHVQDGGPRERAAARPARGHHAADRAHRGDADARRAQAAAPRPTSPTSSATTSRTWAATASSTRRAWSWSGCPIPEGDAEMIAMTVEGLRALGLERFQIDVGQADFFRGILEDVDADEATARELRSALGRKDQARSSASSASWRAPAAVTRAAAGPARRSTGAATCSSARSALVKNARSEAALANLAEVYRLLRAYGLADAVLLDLGEVRGFDYYSGVHFEAYVSGLGAALVGGGRYDQMLGRFGYDCPATGFAFEVGRALLAMESQGAAVDLPGPGLLHHRLHAREDPRARPVPALPRPRRGGGARHHQPAARGVAGLCAPAARALGAGHRRARRAPTPDRCGCSISTAGGGARASPWRSCLERSRRGTFRRLRRRWTCLTSWWSARSGATRARARSWTCSRPTWTWSCATRAATTPGTPWWWGARSSCSRPSPRASCTRAAAA